MNKKKTARNLIIVVALLIILIVLISQIGDISKIYNIITTSANIKCFLVVIAVLIGYVLFYQLSLIFLTKQKYKGLKIYDLFDIAGSEFFFNAITPFSSGGQPFQAYALKRCNVKLSDSTSILLINFLVYQIALNLVSIVFIFMYFSRLSSQISNFTILLVIGFSINLFIMILLVLIGSTKFMGKAIIGIVRLLSKIKFLKKLLSGKEDSFNQYVSDMQIAFKEMFKHPITLLFLLLSKVIALLIYYSIPFFGFLAIGVNLGWENFLYVMACSSFTFTITIWIPTPGASGGAEFAFQTLFASLPVLKNASDTKNLALSGMLIWRFFTYYVLIIYGMILYLIFERRHKNDFFGNNDINDKTNDIIEDEISIN